MAVSFTSDFAALPADALKDHPSVIDAFAYYIFEEDQDYGASLIPTFRL